MKFVNLKMLWLRQAIVRVKGYNQVEPLSGGQPFPPAGEYLSKRVARCLDYRA